jgi:hypothetical protein
LLKLLVAGGLTVITGATTPETQTAHADEGSEQPRFNGQELLPTFGVYYQMIQSHEGQPDKLLGIVLTVNENLDNCVTQWTSESQESSTVIPESWSGWFQDESSGLWWRSTTFRDAREKGTIYLPYGFQLHMVELPNVLETPAIVPPPIGDGKYKLYMNEDYKGAW